MAAGQILPSVRPDDLNRSPLQPRAKSRNDSQSHGRLVVLQSCPVARHAHACVSMALSRSPGDSMSTQAWTYHPTLSIQFLRCTSVPLAKPKGSLDAVRPFQARLSYGAALRLAVEKTTCTFCWTVPSPLAIINTVNAVGRTCTKGSCQGFVDQYYEGRPEKQRNSAQNNDTKNIPPEKRSTSRHFAYLLAETNCCPKNHEPTTGY